MADKRIAVSLTQDEHDAMTEARKASGFRTLSDFLRVSGMQAVARIDLKRKGFDSMKPQPVQITRNDEG